MTTDIKKLIAEARELQREVSRATTLRHGTDDGSNVIGRLADALEASLTQLEAEHQQAEEWQVLWEKAANAVLSFQAERDALRDENRKLIDKLETAMGVSEENDALHDVTDDVRLYCENQGDKFRYHAERILGFLSRAIDTKEEK